MPTIDQKRPFSRSPTTLGSHQTMQTATARFGLTETQSRPLKSSNMIKTASLAHPNSSRARKS